MASTDERTQRKWWREAKGEQCLWEEVLAPYCWWDKDEAGDLIYSHRGDC